jgi:hypothetical protein
VIRATGSSPIRAAATSEPSSTAAAPSLSGDALPAVIVPSGRKLGLRPASFPAGSSAGAFAGTPVIAAAARSSGRTPASAPPNRPNGVRAAA